MYLCILDPLLWFLTRHGDCRGRNNHMKVRIFWVSSSKVVPGWWRALGNRADCGENTVCMTLDLGRKLLRTLPGPPNSTLLRTMTMLGDQMSISYLSRRYLKLQGNAPQYIKASLITPSELRIRQLLLQSATSSIHKRSKTTKMQLTTALLAAFSVAATTVQAQNLTGLPDCAVCYPSPSITQTPD